MDTCMFNYKSYYCDINRKSVRRLQETDESSKWTDPSNKTLLSTGHGMINGFPSGQKL